MKFDAKRRIFVVIMQLLYLILERFTCEHAACCLVAIWVLKLKVVTLTPKKRWKYLMSNRNLLKDIAFVIHHREPAFHITIEYLIQ